MNTKAKIEQIAVTKPALDFWGSSWVTGEALRDAFSLMMSMIDVLVDGKIIGIAEHFLESADIWDLSQP